MDREIYKEDILPLTWADEMELSSQDHNLTTELRTNEELNEEIANDNIDTVGYENISNDGNNSDDESSEEEDECVDEILFDNNTDNEFDVICCNVPNEINATNFNLMANLFGQFKLKEPDYDCLLNLLELSTNYLDIMDKSNVLSSDCIDFVKKYTHFRHDVFNYIFAREVIGVVSKFDSEEPIKYISSKKTPDLVLYKGATVSIYEFTMVMSAYRANFLKGVDKLTSVYKNEINELESMGYSVNYFPIYFSLSDDIETMVDVWSNMGFNVSNIAKNLLIRLKAIIPIEYNYLLSFGFQRSFDINFDEAKLKLADIKQVDDNWRFEIISANRRIFYQILYKLNQYTFVDNENYLIRRAKNNQIYISLTHPKNKRGLTGYKIKEIMHDQYDIYSQFKDICQGNEKCYIKTRKIIQTKQLRKSNHGNMVKSTRLDNDMTVHNYKNMNWFTLDISNKIDNAAANGVMDGLSTPNSIADLKKSMVNYENGLNKWMVETNTPPVVRNNPRRSFIAYIDTSMTYEIPFKQGPTLNNIGIMCVKSNFAKAVYSMRSSINYDEVKQDVIDSKLENLKQIMRSKTAEYYAYLKRFDAVEMKTRHALMVVDNKELFLKLKREATNSQNEYVSQLDNKGLNNNIMNLNQKMIDLYKAEVNWSGNNGYKLYMGKNVDILGLMDDLKLTTRQVNININMPLNENDSEFMLSLKQHALLEFSDHMNEIMKTKLFNNAVFLSRLGYTLAAASNKTFNSKKILLDNLGLSEVLLLVKGGKKMASTRKTKIFKLIYPCEQGLFEWNPTVSHSNAQPFDETPWMQLGQSILLDMIAAPYKIAANYLYLRERYSANISMEIISIPSLLMFHNRRKTEILLHNMRYLCVNPISEYSQVGKMIEEFAQPSYTAFDFSIKHGLKMRYIDYFESIQKWSEQEDNSELSFNQIKVKHPYINRNIHNVHDLTYVFYSTYLMSRGNYGQLVEQTNNLKSVMETHEYYTSLPEKHDYFILDHNDSERIKTDDFGYSPEFCYNVGKLLSAELRRKHATNALNIKWTQIMSTPIDDMANNRGLRDEGKDFFGHKGYYVVYKKIFEQNYDKLINLLDQEHTDQSFHKKLHDLNRTFSKEQSDNKLDKVAFHIVDKEQRGGGREIYVMDYKTKIYQNPLERMFKLICEFIDNEIISVSSAKRAGLIHKKCFEYRSEKYHTYYMTYDCRKWAPRSNPDKYINMLLGMQDVLPQDFFLNTVNYFLKHNRKMIKTRSEVMDAFLTNPDNKRRFSKFIVNNDEEKSSGFIMPYSFVMGIFNMLSSLLHAGGQIYAKYLIEKKYLESGYAIDFDMFAHSDDSGGRLSFTRELDPNIVSKSVISNYEYIMKLMNHLMSTKKCNTSKRYFELLSILYLNHELLPLLPKFLGNIKFNVTGQGLSSDFKQIVSKSIELLSNGASATQAYKVQILLSNMYRNFYRVASDNQLPAFGGFANTWPTFYQSYGSAADEVRICQYNYQYYSKIMWFAVNNLDFEVTDGTINLKYKNVMRYPKAYNSFKKINKIA
jgi:hypothetical protein